MYDLVFFIASQLQVFNLRLGHAWNRISHFLAEQALFHCRHSWSHCPGHSTPGGDGHIPLLHGNYLHCVHKL